MSATGLEPREGAEKAAQLSHPFENQDGMSVEESF